MTVFEFDDYAFEGEIGAVVAHDDQAKAEAVEILNGCKGSWMLVTGDEHGNMVMRIGLFSKPEESEREHLKFCTNIVKALASTIHRPRPEE